MAAPPANVPDVNGVPALNFAAGFSDGVELLIEDTISYFTAQFGPQWGVFLDGAPVVVADSVIEVQYRQEYTISDYPVEQGGFESFDKVAIPFDARVRFSSGGTEANRADLLDSIAAIAGDTNLYDVVTPEETYTSANIMHYDYRRSATNGVGLIQVDVWLRQVRETATSSLSNTQSPNAASQKNDGTVQTTDPTSTQAATASQVK